MPDQEVLTPMSVKVGVSIFPYQGLGKLRTSLGIGYPYDGAVERILAGRGQWWGRGDWTAGQ